MEQYTVTISKALYKPFEQLENKTGEECYDRFGLKRYEHIDIQLTVNNRYILHLAQYIPSEDDSLTYAMATLEDTETNKYYDTAEDGEGILGEWYFFVGDDEISINVELA